MATHDIPKCASQHFGPWQVWPQWLDTSVALWKQGLWDAKRVAEYSAAQDKVVTLYNVDDSGVATISVEGAIVKGDSSMGGTSSIRTRRALRLAVADDDVTAIMLHIDSPGGTVAGSRELADEVTATRQHKPVYAHIDDLGASAAYNLASRAERITANESAMIGSIGTLAVLTDYSGAAEKDGIKVNVLSTGPHKGAGVPGSKITDDQLAAEQKLIDQLGQQFVASVNEARGLNLNMGEGAADGRVFLAADAMGLGLIDEVTSFDAAVENLQLEHGNMTPEQLMEKHPDQVASLVDAALTKERVELDSKARTDAKAMLDAAGGDHKLAFESFVNGKAIETVEAVAADRKARADAAPDEPADQSVGTAAELATLKAQVAAMSGEEPVAIDSAAGIADDESPEGKKKARVAAGAKRITNKAAREQYIRSEGLDPADFPQD